MYNRKLELVSCVSGGFIVRKFFHLSQRQNTYTCVRYVNLSAVSFHSIFSFESSLPRMTLSLSLWLLSLLFSLSRFTYLPVLSQNCSSSLNSVVRRGDNRMHFARQGSASQGYFMRQATVEEVSLPFSHSPCVLIIFRVNDLFLFNSNIALRKRIPNKS